MRARAYMCPRCRTFFTADEARGFEPHDCDCPECGCKNRPQPVLLSHLLGRWFLLAIKESASADMG